jgi:hypothetical protein
LLLEPGDYVEQRHARGPAHLPEFDQVEPPFPRLVLGNERLGLVQEPGHVFLSEPRAEPELAEYKLQSLLLRREDALPHGDSRSDLISYPNSG